MGDSAARRSRSGADPAAREAFLAAQRKEAGGADTLDTAVAKAVRAQASKAGFKWE